jgi:uncharacterized protein (DUF305 family)
MRISAGPTIRIVKAALLAMPIVSLACTRALSVEPPAAQPAPPENAQPRVNSADLEFMSGMIHHHAQAVLIASWAPTHEASNSVRVLAERIAVAQQDEIAIMQTWLRDQDQPVTEATPTGRKMTMNGVEHVMLMPGMLTDEQLAQLDRARGPDFDRLFLTLMIQHHNGALTMVEKLLQSYGAAQDEVVFRFSSDVYADQTTEIKRMQTMLDQMESAR